MTPQFTFSKFEECIAYYKANPPIGGKVELDFTDEELIYIENKTHQYDCSPDIFLSAVLACFMGEDQAIAGQPNPVETEPA